MTRLALAGSADPPAGTQIISVPLPSATSECSYIPLTPLSAAESDRRAGPVPEEDAGGAVVVVGVAGQRLGADHHCCLDLSRDHELAGDVQAVEEPGAGGRDVEAGGVLHAERRLDDRRRGRDRLLHGGGGQDQQLDLLRGDAGVGHGPPPGLDRQGGYALLRPDNVALADPGARHDPLVRRVHHALEVLVGEDLLGQGVSPCPRSVR